MKERGEPVVIMGAVVPVDVLVIKVLIPRSSGLVLNVAVAACYVSDGSCLSYSSATTLTGRA